MSDEEAMTSYTLNKNDLGRKGDMTKPEDKHLL